MPSKLNRKYPVKPRQKDPRDLIFRNSFKVTDQVNVPVVDFLPFAGPVRDQGQEGSCSGHAWAGHRELIYNKFYDNEVNKDVPVNTINLSPQYLYYKERMLEGTTASDAGAQIITGAQVLNKFGCCLESLDGYSDQKWKVPVTPEQDAAATAYISGAYHRLDDLSDVKSCLRSGYPVTIGMTVYSSFESDYIAKTGDMLMPDVNNEEVLGGHAILIVGYNDVKQKLTIRNSWGTGWGASGNFYMGYKIYETNGVIMDAWMQHLGPAWVDEDPSN